MDEMYKSWAMKFLIMGGTTATMAALRGSKLLVAGVGDSTGIMCRGGKAVKISIDHKPNAPSEKARIEGRRLLPPLIMHSSTLIPPRHARSLARNALFSLQFAPI